MPSIIDASLVPSVIINYMPVIIGKWTKFLVQVLNKVSVALIVNRTLKIEKEKKSIYYIQKCTISDQKLVMFPIKYIHSIFEHRLQKLNVM